MDKFGSIEFHHHMEMERKFLVKDLPDLSKLIPLHYERHFIYVQSGVQLRIQQKGEKFELERKVRINALSSQKDKLEISKAEFEILKTLSMGQIIRDSYQIQELKNTTLKIYQSPIPGFARLEVEFESEQEALEFTPPPWFGEEITGTEQATDAGLIS